MRNHRVRDLGPSARPCPTCAAQGTLQVTEVQDMRRWAVVLRRKDREPYRLARCSQCRTTIPVRITDT